MHDARLPVLGRRVCFGSLLVLKLVHPLVLTLVHMLVLTHVLKLVHLLVLKLVHLLVHLLYASGVCWFSAVFFFVVGRVVFFWGLVVLIFC